MKEELISDTSSFLSNKEEDLELSLYQDEEDAYENVNFKKIHAVKEKSGEVNVFKDKSKLVKIATYPKNSTIKPTKKNKFLMVNCIRYKLSWI